MGVPTSEVGYTSATTGRGDHKVHHGHVVALDLKKVFQTKITGYSPLATQCICHIVPHVSSLIVATALSTWSCVRDADGQPEQTSSVTRVRPNLTFGVGIFLLNFSTPCI
jgi:hypothetical protein